MLGPDLLNRSLFQLPDIVADYVERSQLFLPEQRVFQELGGKLANSDVLDIGVGGGRTSGHLMSACRTYRGIDYAPAMVAACRARFPEAPAMTFFQADARFLPLDERSIDVAIFSHNGIDCMSHENRLAVLQEVHRVLKPNGLFFFSSHSLHVYPFQDQELQSLNSEVDIGLLKTRGWAIVRDNVSWFYYIYPNTQIKQLKEMNFEPMTAYDMNGKEHDCSTVNDHYMIHYLCRVPA